MLKGKKPTRCRSVIGSSYSSGCFCWVQLALFICNPYCPYAHWCPYTGIHRERCFYKVPKHVVFIQHNTGVRILCIYKFFLSPRCCPASTLSPLSSPSPWSQSSRMTSSFEIWGNLRLNGFNDLLSVTLFRNWVRTWFLSSFFLCLPSLSLFFHPSSLTFILPSSSLSSFIKCLQGALLGAGDRRMRSTWLLPLRRHSRRSRKYINTSGEGNFGK